ncbi:restriction endonuclease subunit S [Candidatus Liberibacter solanacearum]|uniref:restriction endonuclease subunit S n=1 Tax=Candidatus Liberibacter solanacearum TaxID=556287 RepID=UPI0009B66E08
MNTTAIVLRKALATTGLSTKNLFNKKSITIANNGSIGSSFYQSRDFYATADVSVIRNKHLNLSAFIPFQIL